MPSTATRFVRASSAEIASSDSSRCSRHVMAEALHGSCTRKVRRARPRTDARTESEETIMKKILLGTMLALAAGAAADVQAQRYYDRDDRYDYEYARYERCNSCGEVIDINR